MSLGGSLLNDATEIGSSLLGDATGIGSSLLTDTTEIGSSLLRNAGSKDSVMSAVEGLTSSGQPKTPDPKGNVLPDLVKELETDEAYLKGLADNDPDFETPQDKGNLQPYDLATFWPSAPTTESPTVPPSFSSNINKCLTLNAIPTALEVGKDAIDVGKTIAQQIFHASPGIQVPIKENPKVLKELFDIQKEGGAEIKGGHLFYKIPLGNKDLDEGWHSYLRVYNAPSTKAI